MTTGAYADAIKAFDNADTVQQTPLSSFQRIRCYCALSNLEGAFEQMQLAMHQAPNEKFMQYDYKILLQLLSAVRSFAFTKGDNNEPDEGGIKEQMEIINNCIQQIGTIITQFEKNEHLKIKKDGSPMTIQIIPNVNRIKIEKNLVIKKLQPHQEGIPQYTPLSKSEEKELEGIPFNGYYRENIFSLEEMYLYRAIFSLYTKNYKSALNDLEKAWRQHFT
jgi:tetratricopeptide (TPR) repeat protein